MNTELTLQQQIAFEPGTAGSGSLWTGDDLLATLTVTKRTARKGRLSLRNANLAYDMLRSTRQPRVGYRMAQNLRQVAHAEWNTGDPSATLHYKGQDYIATPESLLKVCGDRLLLTLALAPDWIAHQTKLDLAGVADLPLIAFYLFVAYDLNPSAR